MSVDIENREACGPVREPTSHAGGTMTRLVSDTLRNPPQRKMRHRNDATLIADIRVIGERCAKALRPGPSSGEIGDFLYDQRGLPK